MGVADTTGDVANGVFHVTDHTPDALAVTTVFCTTDTRVASTRGAHAMPVPTLPAGASGGNTMEHVGVGTEGAGVTDWECAAPAKSSPRPIINLTIS